MADLRGTFRMRDLPGLLIPRPSRVAYVGAPRLENFGDRLLLEVHQEQFPELQFSIFPGGGRNRTLRVLSRLQPSSAHAAFLGGGTLVGREPYRHRIEALVAAFSDLPVVTFGVGVEDPTYERRRTTTEELVAWKPILDRIAHLGVRGPRSCEILADVGIKAQVTGDPGLLITPTQQASTRRGLLGLSVGAGSDQWGSDYRRTLEVVAAVGRLLTDKGWSLRIFVMDPQELYQARYLEEQIQIDSIVTSGSTQALIDSIAECNVFLGQKLHAIVAAAAASVPSVTLEYRPKCADFQRSIGREQYAIRTDELSVGAIIEMIDDLASNSDLHADEIAHAVDQLRTGLRAQRFAVQGVLAQKVPGLE